MPQAVQNTCCQLRTCTTTSARFVKLYLDVDVLELCIRNMGPETSGMIGKITEQGPSKKQPIPSCGKN